jgi:hypothetical protein
MKFTTLNVNLSPLKFQVTASSRHATFLNYLERNIVVLPFFCFTSHG